MFSSYYKIYNEISRCLEVILFLVGEIMTRAKFDREIKIRNLSKNTAETYWSFVMKLKCFSKKPLNRIGEEDLKRYLSHEHDSGRAGKTYLDVYAFKFYFRDVLGMQWDLLITRQKRAAQKLPQVFSKAQARLLFDNIKDPAIRLPLLLCYGSGLRISEALSLRPCNILAEQGVIKLLGKGQKERATVLPKYLLTELRKFWAMHRRTAAKDSYIFVRKKSDKPLDYHTLLKEFNKIKNKLSLPSDVTIHSLRHSFATDIQQQGIDLLTLQYMMGHSSIQTTRRYLHLSLTSNPDICSPLDRMYNAA